MKINRRKFLKLTAAGAASTSVAAIMANSDKTNVLETTSGSLPNDAKKIFHECGT